MLTQNKLFTIFTTPKPFVGHNKVIQDNAIRSWLKLDAEIILFGKGEGVAEAAKEFGVRHYPDVPTNEYGTPYIAEMFAMATAAASSKILCYANSDIIFLSGITVAVKALGQEIPNEFLVIGERWKCDITEPLYKFDSDFYVSVLQNHTLDTFYGMDYFIFPKGMIRTMPRFVIGRAGWDNWMVYTAMERGIRVIDATKCIIPIHQNHNYSHVPGKVSATWKNSPESNHNLALIGNKYSSIWGLEDADYLMNRHGEIERRIAPLKNMIHFVILKSPKLFSPLIEIGSVVGHYVKWGVIHTCKSLKNNRKD